MEQGLDLRLLAEECLDSDTHFVVDTVVSPGKGTKKILVTVDGDNGIDIEACSKISRKLSAKLEVLLGETPYTLEVSSPGLDQPLRSIRQYRKNQGRKVRVFTGDKEYLGTLSVVSDEIIRINQSTGKGKKQESTDIDIPLSDVRKTIVQVSF